jgi:uncharacterized oxidoreductase
MAPAYIRVAADKLRDFVTEIFVAAGCSPAESGRIGFYLVNANLAGHDSHGVIRVPRYVRNRREGDTTPDVVVDVVLENPTMAVVDGKYGFGQTVAPQAVDIGLAKAKAGGAAVVALRNSGHIGRIGDWAERAAAAGQISIHFVNVAGSRLVAPFGGVDRRMSTNPFCVGVPMDPDPPLVLDFATSLVAEGKVLVASNGGKPVPDNALIEPDGRMSGDPAVLYGPLTANNPRDPRNGSGAIRAFGEHKGSGLAFICEILAGALAGGGCAGPPRDIGGRGRIANGMLSIYLAPSFYGSPEAFREEAKRYIAWFKDSRPASRGGEVLVPGEPEARARAERLANGVPLQPDTWAGLQGTARDVGLAAERIPRPLG